MAERFVKGLPAARLIELGSKLPPSRPFISPARMAALIDGRYGYPGEPGQLKRSVNYRVKALDWELERFAELIRFDPDLAGAVMGCGPKDFHRAIMIMRSKTGRYLAEGGNVRLEVDQFIRRQLGQTEDVRR
jgi:hypothetical protein